MQQLTVGHVLTRSLSANTRLAYEKGWRRFVSFCEETGREAMEATGEDVAQFLVHTASQPRSRRATTGGNRPVSLGTLQISLSAINRKYKDAGRESPGHSVVVAAVVHGLTRIRGTGQRKVKAIREYEMRKMLACCDRRAQSGFFRVVSVRDAALLAIGFAGALRRSEICQLNVEDVDFIGQPDEHDGLYLTIRRSKTDQAAKGQRIAIPAGKGLNAVARLHRWLALSQATEGPLFQSLWRGGRLRGRRLHHSDIPRLVKHYVQAIGLDPAEYSGHSLRAGFVTSAAVHGARLDKIMEVTRHNSAEMVLRYIRQVEAFEDHAGAAFL